MKITSPHLRCSLLASKGRTSEAFCNWRTAPLLQLLLKRKLVEHCLINSSIQVKCIFNQLIIKICNLYKYKTHGMQLIYHQTLAGDCSVAPDGSKEYARYVGSVQLKKQGHFWGLFQYGQLRWCTALRLHSFQNSLPRKKQKMNGSITPSFDIPAAFLQTFINLTIVFTVPIYDPCSKILHWKPARIMMLQRIGTRLF